MFNNEKQDIITLSNGHYNVIGFGIKRLSVSKFLTTLDEYFTETDDFITDSYGEFKRNNDDTNKIIRKYL